MIHEEKKSKHYQKDLFQQGLRFCNKCKEIKNISHFKNSSNNTCGLDYWCKDCVRIYKRIFKKSNNARRKRYCEKHKLKVIESNENWRSKNLDYRKNEIQSLSDNYIKERLRGQFEIDTKEITPELIELKRTEIQIKRTKKELLNQIKNQENDN